MSAKPSTWETEADGGDLIVLRERQTFDSDAELLDALRQEHVQEVTRAALYDRIQSHINALVWKMLGDDDEHDDVVHSILCRVYEKIHTLRDASGLDAWVRSVTLNHVRNVFHRRQRRRWVPWAPRHEGPTLEPNAKLDARELLRHLYDALDRLSPEERMVFVLRHVERQSHAEIGSALGFSVSTVKRRLARSETHLLN